jgi:hypothetical protein
MFTVSKLNMLEKRFLEFLDYDVNISSRLYAKYYFELRALSEEQSNRAFSLQPLSAKDARLLESRALFFAGLMHFIVCISRCGVLFQVRGGNCMQVIPMNPLVTNVEG